MAGSSNTRQVRSRSVTEETMRVEESVAPPYYYTSNATTSAHLHVVLPVENAHLLEVKLVELAVPLRLPARDAIQIAKLLARDAAQNSTSGASLVTRNAVQDASGKRCLP